MMPRRRKGDGFCAMRGYALHVTENEVSGETACYLFFPLQGKSFLLKVICITRGIRKD